MIVVGETVGRWVAEKAKCTWTSACRAIGWMRGGQLIAGVLYDGFTGASIAMHSRCDDPRKVSRDWLFAIFDYPFNQLGCKRVTGLVSTANQRAQDTNEHLGWKRETVLKDYFLDGDGIVYVMRKEDCRWLRFRQKHSKG